MIVLVLPHACVHGREYRRHADIGQPDPHAWSPRPLIKATVGDQHPYRPLRHLGLEHGERARHHAHIGPHALLRDDNAQAPGVGVFRMCVSLYVSTYNYARPVWLHVCWRGLFVRLGSPRLYYVPTCLCMFDYARLARFTRFAPCTGGRGFLCVWFGACSAKQHRFCRLHHALHTLNHTH